MGDNYFSTRLRYSAHAGLAKLHGHAVVLTDPPIICGQPVYSIDYVPEVGICEITPRACDPRRDMLPAEIVDADALLRQLA